MLVKTHSQIVTIPRDFPAGQVVAVDVSEDEYMEQYANAFHEWIEGVVIKMSPISLKHHDLVEYLHDLLRTFFSMKPVARTSAVYCFRRAACAGNAGRIKSAELIRTALLITARKSPQIWH